MPENKTDCELFIIGSGLTGLTASLFAARNGIRTVRTGQAGELTFASGMIDLLGKLPESGDMVEDPFEGISRLKDILPDHPYAKLPVEDIEFAIRELVAFLNDAGLKYHIGSGRNRMMLTGIGTTRSTYAIPDAMIEGVRALEEKSPCLIVDIKGMKGFSSRQIVESLKKDWPELRHVTVTFPDAGGEVFGENLSFAVEQPATLKRFAEEIKPHIKNSTAVGLPAILGNIKHSKVKSDLEKMLGVPVFEIPGLPPSIPGTRIKTVFENVLQEKGVIHTGKKRVTGYEITEEGRYRFQIGDKGDPSALIVESDAVLICTGRFMGKGLTADYTSIYETVFDLPLKQPEGRDQWHSRDFFDKNGHAVNKAGILTDTGFRPIGADGKPVMENLFAAGSILADNDWKRLKCGAGSAVASAYGAVRSYLEQRK